MSLTYRFVNWAIKRLSHMLVRTDLKQMEKVPAKGPLIIAVNHVNFLDAPVFYVHALPRPMTALVKIETWDNPLLGPLFTLWKGIPIRRYELDLKAFQEAQRVIADGTILVISPEGTRSGDGRLRKGLPGIVLLAARTGAPILPAAYYGHETFWQRIKKMRRSEFNLVVGEPFRLNIKGIALSREVRQQVTDEIMYQIAALLPEKYRGAYSDMSRATEEYIAFEKGRASNLGKLRGMLPAKAPAS
jgi:1-acyl-sn-glycerol-3-phosphate acyltransferase